ncbi:hypothetical protein O7608_02345 [Solwaraspora sp. WMMA2056]|uniref:hypothetical protein n=1 Tax=Solwaraspora sp. WMMA2056 TaxID=3015161 RepID=UPI00259B58D3|nr:hypothetical protein [Solwaraspora sp. WMMA2056]WJK41301.1 hypothetical protein O7608_02345 [Solwaraspora sp. WMMA2056]
MMPEKPVERRRRIVLLGRDDYNRARMVSPELLIDPLTTVIAIPLRPPLDDDPEIRAIVNRFHPGTLLIRNVWESGSYVDAAAAYERISVAKFTVFANVCQRLGATRLEIKEIREVTDQGEVSASVTFQAGAAAGNTSAGSTSLRRVAQSLHASWVWESGPGDADAATAYATEQGIQDDPAVGDLIRQRGYEQNRIREHQLELDITAEARNEIQGALNLESVLRKLGPSFDGEFKSMKAASQQLSLRVQVEFR